MLAQVLKTDQNCKLEHLSTTLTWRFPFLPLPFPTSQLLDAVPQECGLVTCTPSYCSFYPMETGARCHSCTASAPPVPGPPASSTTGCFPSTLSSHCPAQPGPSLGRSETSPNQESAKDLGDFNKLYSLYHKLMRGGGVPRGKLCLFPIYNT